MSETKTPALVTECCGAAIEDGSRYCPRCEYEARVVPPTTPEASGQALVADMLAVLKSIEWNGHGLRRCPMCFGWESKGNGETDYHHNKTCQLAKVIVRAESQP